MSSTTISTSTLASRPSFARSKTMPAFRRALSMPSVDKSLASLRKSSMKSLQRISSFRDSQTTSNQVAASTSTASIPVFTTPDYTHAASSCPPAVSPTKRPSFKRAMTPAPVRAMRSAVLATILGFKKTSESPSRKSSVASVASVSSFASSATSRRQPSVCSVESFSSTEDKMTLSLRLHALPSTLLGFITSIIAVILIHMLPAMAANPPKRKPAPRPYEREIFLTEEQELNPARLPPSSTTITPRLSRRLTKTYRRTLRRAARARRASTPHEALAVFFARTPKRVCAKTPMRVDPKTLLSDISLFVYTSPIALPLPKGPAPVVRPARKQRRFTELPTVAEESVNDALCAGW
ncbi:hypothetical protein B0H16DRAFT_1470815 [Mycena metata]|uniref:Uncharacterized protein n=1 Tax=Mycena metata TaxID=1033252 RepID=A0AAD7MRL5_9AGAR|nr:hypothetical protein B0H16DRAFT_1470815 [Mycena metata]